MSVPKRPSRFRLDPAIRPEEYDLHLEPDLTNGTFRGEVRIELGLTAPRSAITLHAADMEVTRATVASKAEVQELRVKRQPADETVTLVARRPIDGRAVVSLEFTGRLGAHLRGLYAATADGQRYAFTQLEAADARRMLPCFDEPTFKARFRISVTTAEERRDLATAPSTASRSMATAVAPCISRRRRSCPPISSLSPSARSSASVRRLRFDGDPRVACARQGAPQRASRLEAAVQALSRLEDYFGIPYPYGKLDLVAVPDFEAGAMENAGAVFFRETLLLLDPADRVARRAASAPPR